MLIQVNQIETNNRIRGVPNTLKKQGVKGIFYEGPIICVSYKSGLITFKVHKQNQSEL